MTEAYHECGVGAIYFKNLSASSVDVPISLINMALALQHRGQKSAGISVYNPFGRSILVSHKDLGLVPEVFRVSSPMDYKRIIEHCKGIAGIVHTRYSTSGNKGDFYAARDEVQPFERRHGRIWKRFSLAFNGNLANYRELRKDLTMNDYWLDTDVDTEVLMHTFSLQINEKTKRDDKRDVKPDLFSVAQGVMNKLDGAYNVVTMFADGNLLVIRDPHGVRPLVWGENEGFYAVSSESSAFEQLGISNFKDVRPGEAIIFNNAGVKTQRLVEGKQKLCQFELVYFARANSRIDDVYVKQARENLGKEIASIEPLKERLDSNYLVVPAPLTAISAAEAYAEELKLRYRNAIEKRDGLRGFINDIAERRRIMNGAYIVHEGDVFGKKIILFDDSIVRGETSRVLISRIRKAGAVEVHLRLTEPPIKFPCFYGIDFPTRGELIANQVVGDLEEKIAEFINADSVIFQTIEGLERAFEGLKGRLCMACLTGEYPTLYGQRLFESQPAV